MGQKRILVYSESFLPSLGGLENNTLLLCESLSEMGYAVSLLTPQKNAQSNERFQVVESRSMLTFIKEIAKNNLIIVNGGVSFKALLPCLLMGKSYWIIYQMASLFKDISVKGWIGSSKNNLRFLIAKKAQKNIGVSKYSEEELQTSFTKLQTGLLINPASPFYKLNHTTKTLGKPFICLFSGRLIEGKGIHLLINVVKALYEEGNEIVLRIAGQGEAEADLFENLHPSFVMMGSLNQESLAQEYRKAHLTIIPSTTHIEGSPLSMAESLICGTPVLCSDQGAMAKSLQDEDLIFKSGDALDLKLKLSRLMKIENYSRAVKHCHQLAAVYSYDYYAKTLNNLMDSADV